MLFCAAGLVSCSSTFTSYSKVSEHSMVKCQNESERVLYIMQLIQSGDIAQGMNIGHLRDFIPAGRLYLDESKEDGIAMVDLCDRPAVSDPLEVPYAWTGWYLKVWYQDNSVMYYVLCDIHMSIMNVEVVENTKSFMSLYHQLVSAYRKNNGKIKADYIALPEDDHVRSKNSPK